MTAMVGYGSQGLCRLHLMKLTFLIDWACRTCGWSDISVHVSSQLLDLGGHHRAVLRRARRRSAVRPRHLPRSGQLHQSSVSTLQSHTGFQKNNVGEPVLERPLVRLRSREGTDRLWKSLWNMDRVTRMKLRSDTNF
jgi:hypothetical protein